MRHVREAIGGGGGEEEEEINQFKRLPDDVVLIIFDKVSEIKWLCRCFMVSKRFSSLIPLVQAVSIKTSIPSKPSMKKKKKNPQGNNSLSEKFSKFLINNVLKPFRYLHKLVHSRPLQSNVPPCLVFLNSLKQIRFLNFEFVSDWNAIDCFFSKWGAKFTVKHASLSFLFATSLSKITEPEEEEEEEQEEKEEEEMMRRYSYVGWWVGMWPRILSDVAPGHPMLESITISDSINKGILMPCLCGEKLVECRNDVNWSWGNRV